MNITSQLNIKPLYRITGTPENFLTALRFFTWGFNDVKHWNNLLPGDIIFFHSKASDSKFLKKSKSCIIGFGVTGDSFFIDSKPLWIDELEDGKSYPYKFHFSEMYFFADVPLNEDWDSTSFKRRENTIQILNKLLEAGVALGALEHFPKMGSYSAIQDLDVKRVLLSLTGQLTLYRNNNYNEQVSKTSKLEEVREEYEALRYATSLTVFDDIQKRIINKSRISFDYSLEKLKTAETQHFNIVKLLRSTLQEKGYKVYQNNHIDLFAHNKTNSLLIEAKSIENKNFKSQSRKGIIQLFEYNHFEVSKFKREHELSFDSELKLLATSDKPSDDEYVGFINSLDIRTLAIRDNKIIKYGESINLMSI